MIREPAPAPPKTCDRCGVGMVREAEADHRSWARKRFCSDKCRKDSSKDPVKRCVRCSAQFEKPAATGGSSSWGRRLYCSPECYSASRIKTVDEYLASRAVKAANGCLIWTGQFDADGFPQTGQRKTKRIVRAVYERFVGPIPPDHAVRQTCQNKRCVNFEHMETIPRLRAEWLSASVAPPLRYRRHLTPLLKLRCVLINGNKCSKCGEPVTDYAAAQFDHDPPIQLRPWNADTGDTEPSCSDPRYIFPMHVDCHLHKTKGDVTAIAKTKRVSAKEGDHRQRLAAKAADGQRAFVARLLAKGTEEPPGPPRRGRKMPSRPFRRKAQ